MIRKEERERQQEKDEIMGDKKTNRPRNQGGKGEEIVLSL